jgi:hypothetical protein
LPIPPQHWGLLRQERRDGVEGATMARRVPLPLRSIRAYIEHSMKLFVCGQLGREMGHATSLLARQGPRRPLVLGQETTHSLEARRRMCREYPSRLVARAAGFLSTSCLRQSASCLPPVCILSQYPAFDLRLDIDGYVWIQQISIWIYKWLVHGYTVWI